MINTKERKCALAYSGRLHYSSAPNRPHKHSSKQEARFCTTKAMGARACVPVFARDSGLGHTRMHACMRASARFHVKPHGNANEKIISRVLLSLNWIALESANSTLNQWGSYFGLSINLTSAYPRAGTFNSVANT
jgi:hypothetical protein